jgi:hypothetical protein
VDEAPVELVMVETRAAAPAVATTPASTVGRGRTGAGATPSASPVVPDAPLVQVETRGN